MNKYTGFFVKKEMVFRWRTNVKLCTRGL